MILIAQEWGRVLDFEPERAFVILGMIRDIFFPDISVLQSFNILFPHLNRALCPFFGLRGP